MLKSLNTFIQIHKRVRHHATIFSFIVVVFLFGLFLEAYMHDFNLVYIVLFFVFSLAFSAVPLGVLNLGRLEVSYLPSGRFFAKEDGKIKLNINNPSNQSIWSVVLHNKNDTYTVSIPHIKAKSSFVAEISFIPQKRGRFSSEEIYLESKYPLSISRLTMSIDKKYESLAYPQPKGKTVSAFLNQDESLYGEEIEFDGLQSYDGTQRLSMIHWASVARGEVSVKIFSKEAQAPNLIFDFYKAGREKEERLSQLSLWVLECERRNISFKLNLPHKSMHSAKDSIDEILTALAIF